MDEPGVDQIPPEIIGPDPPMVQQSRHNLGGSLSEKSIVLEKRLGITV